MIVQAGHATGFPIELVDRVVGSVESLARLCEGPLSSQAFLKML